MTENSRIVRASHKGTHEYAIFETKVSADDASPIFSVTVSGPQGGYLVTAIRSLSDADRITQILPHPSDINSGTRLIGVFDIDFSGNEVRHTCYFLLENPDDKGGLEFDRLYDAEGLASGIPVETAARRPDLAIVAIEETENWAEKVVAVCGRIKGVYGVNRNDQTYPQVWMEFLSNQFERPMFDLDESQTDEEFRKIGYDTQTDFEEDNSGERGREIGRYEAPDLDVIEVLDPPAEWIVAYMLEPSEGRRLELEREYYWEVKSNGLPSASFENPRSDAEILEDGIRLTAGDEAPAP